MIAIVLLSLLALIVVAAAIFMAARAASTRELAALISELRGRVDALVGEKDLRSKDLEKERETYKQLTTQWNERLSAIDTSLERISTEASDKVSDMSSQLKPIISIFRSPQIAGIEFGEAELEVLLKTHLGEGLYMRKPRLLAVGQDVVDFAIKLPDCLVPIDSKFPSTQYRAWVEAQTEAEAKVAWRAFRDQFVRQMEAAAKYIKPDAGTTDYALMFVPSDVIYQQAFLTHRIYEQDNPIPQKAAQLQVFGCSPQTLLPIFSLIRLGLRNLKIAEDVKGIRSQLDELHAVFSKGFLEGEWKTLREHVRQLADHVDKMGLDKSHLSRVKDAIRRLNDLSRDTRPSLELKTVESGDTLMLREEG